MRKGIIYIHGKGGNAEEAKRYEPLFPDGDVIGFDYRATTPWEAREEFPAFFEAVEREHSGVQLIANSIGAFFTMSALSGRAIERAYFISPIVDMERLILDMMVWANVTEADLAREGEIETAFGETLSMEYLKWVRAMGDHWNVPTEVLYGERDNLQSRETIERFAREKGAGLTVMEGGEHWFHTGLQLEFLDSWLRRVAVR